MSTFDMLSNQLLEAEVDRLGSPVELRSNLRIGLVLITAETNHLALLRHRPAVVVLGVDDAGGGSDRALDRVLRASVHFVVKQCLLLCNRIRFECMKLDWMECVERNEMECAARRD